MSLQSLLPYWLIALALTLVLTRLLKNKWQKESQAFLILLASIFVISFLGQAITKRTNNPIASANTTNKAEIPLRVDLAGQIIYQNISGKAGLLGISKQKKSDLEIIAPSESVFKEAYKIISQAIKQNPKAHIPKLEFIVLLGSTNPKKYQNEINTLISELSNNPNEQVLSLTKCLSAIYTGNGESNSSCEKVIKESVLTGWFKDVALLKFYKNINNQNLFVATLDEMKNQYTKVAMRLSIIFVIALLAGLIGIVSIILYCSTYKENESNFLAGTKPNIKSVYVVFLTWFVTQITISWAWHLLSGHFKAFTSDPLLAASFTCLTYLLCNIPGIAYIWYFVFKEKQIKFWQNISLTIPKKNLDKVGIVLTGIVGWCTALPLVFVSYQIASRFLGSQGSDNPVLTLVIQAATSGQILPIAILIITIGVIAPFCEEILFRGFLYGYLRHRFPTILSAFISALCFSLAHFDKGGMLPLLSIGFVLALVYERSRNLLASMITHGIWNISSFTIALVIFGTK